MEWPREHHYREGNLLVINQDYHPSRFGRMNEKCPSFHRGNHRGLGQRSRHNYRNVTHGIGPRNNYNSNQFNNGNHQEQFLHPRNEDIDYYHDRNDAPDELYNYDYMGRLHYEDGNHRNNYNDDYYDNSFNSEYQHSSNKFRTQNDDWNRRHQNPSYYDEDYDRRDNMRYENTHYNDNYVERNYNKYNLNRHVSDGSIKRREDRRLRQRTKPYENAPKKVVEKRKKCESMSSGSDNSFESDRRRKRSSNSSSSNSKRKDNLYDSDEYGSDSDKKKISSKYSDDKKQINSKCENNNDNIQVDQPKNPTEEDEKVCQENPNSLSFRNSPKIHSLPIEMSPTKENVLPPANQELISCKTTKIIFPNPIKIDLQPKLDSQDLPNSSDKNNTLPLLIPDNATDLNTNPSNNEVKKVLTNSYPQHESPNKCSKIAVVVIEDIFKPKTNSTTNCNKTKYNLYDIDKYIIDSERSRISSKNSDDKKQLTSKSKTNNDNYKVDPSKNSIDYCLALSNKEVEKVCQDNQTNNNNKITKVVNFPKRNLISEENVTEMKPQEVQSSPLISVDIKDKSNLPVDKSSFCFPRSRNTSEVLNEIPNPFQSQQIPHCPDLNLLSEEDSNKNKTELKLHESNKKKQGLPLIFVDTNDENNLTEENSRISYLKICNTSLSSSPCEALNKVTQDHAPNVFPTVENIENNIVSTIITPSTNTEAEQILHCQNLNLLSIEESNKNKTKVQLHESNTETQVKTSVSFNASEVLNKVPQDDAPKVMPTEENIENNTTGTKIPLSTNTEILPLNTYSIDDDFLAYVDAQLEISFNERLKKKSLTENVRTSLSQGKTYSKVSKNVLPTFHAITDPSRLREENSEYSCLKIVPQQKDEEFNNASELSAEINDLLDQSAESSTTKVDGEIIIDNVETVTTVDNDSIENDISLDTNILNNKPDGVDNTIKEVVLNMDSVTRISAEILYLKDDDTLMFDCASVEVKTEEDKYIALYSESYQEADNINNVEEATDLTNAQTENKINEDYVTAIPEDMTEEFLELALSSIETHQNEVEAEYTVGNVNNGTEDKDTEADEDMNEDFLDFPSDLVSALTSVIQRAAIGIKDKDIFFKCVNQLSAWPIVVIEKLSEKKIKMHNGRFPPCSQENWSGHPPSSYPPPQRYPPEQPWHNNNYPPFYGPNVYQGNGNWSYPPGLMGNESNNMNWSHHVPCNINFHCSGFNRPRGRPRGRPKKYGYSYERRNSTMNRIQSVTNNQRARSRSRSSRRRNNSNSENEVKNKSEKQQEKTSEDTAESSLPLKKGVEVEKEIQNEAVSIQSSSAENSCSSVQEASQHKNAKVQRMDSVETVTFADESDSATVKTNRSKTSTYSESVKSNTSEPINNSLLQTNKIEPKEESDSLLIESIDSDSTYVSNHENSKPNKSILKRYTQAKSAGKICDEIICISSSSFSDTEIDEKKNNNENEIEQKKKKLTKKTIKNKQRLCRKRNRKSVQSVSEARKTNCTKILALIDSTDSESDSTQIKQEIDVKTEQAAENITELVQVKPTYTANEESDSSMSADTVIREDRTYYKIVENGISDSDSQFDVRELSASPTELDKNERVQKWIEFQDINGLKAEGDLYNAKGNSLSDKFKYLFDSDPLRREEANKHKETLEKNTDSHMRKRKKLLKNRKTKLIVDTSSETERMSKKRRLTEDLPYPTVSENIDKNTKISKISSNHNTGSVIKEPVKSHCVTNEKQTIADNHTNPTNVITERNTKSDQAKGKVCSTTSSKSKSSKSSSGASSKEKVSSSKLSNKHSTNKSHQSKEHASSCKSDSVELNKHESKKLKSSKDSRHSVKNSAHSNKDKSKDYVHKKNRATISSVEQLPVPDKNIQIFHMPSLNLNDSDKSDKIDHVNSSNNTGLSENNLQSAIPLKPNEVAIEAQINPDLPDSLSVELLDLNVIDSIFPSALDNPNDETNNDVTLIVVPPTPVIAPIEEVSIAPSINQEQVIIERKASPSILEDPIVLNPCKEQENRSDLPETLPMPTNNVSSNSISNTIAPLPSVAINALQNQNAILNPIIPGRLRVRPISTMISKQFDFINSEEILLIAQHIFIQYQDYSLYESQVAGMSSRRDELKKQYDNLNRLDSIRFKIIIRIMNDIHQKYKTTFNPLEDTIIQNILYQKISDLNCKFPNQYTIDMHRRILKFISIRYTLFYSNCTCIRCIQTNQRKTPSNQNNVTNNLPANQSAQSYTTRQPHNPVQISSQELRSTQQSTTPLNVAQQSTVPLNVAQQFIASQQSTVPLNVTQQFIASQQSTVPLNVAQQFSAPQQSTVPLNAAQQFIASQQSTVPLNVTQQFSAPQQSTVPLNVAQQFSAPQQSTVPVHVAQQFIASQQSTVPLNAAQQFIASQQSTVPLNVTQQFSGLQQSRGVQPFSSTSVQQINYTHQVAAQFNGHQQSSVAQQQVHYAQQHSAPHQVQSVQRRTSNYEQDAGLTQQPILQQFNSVHQYLPVPANRTNYMQQTNLMQQSSVNSESMGVTPSNYTPTAALEVSQDLNRTNKNMDGINEFSNGVVNMQNRQSNVPNSFSYGSETFTNNVSQSLPNQLHSKSFHNTVQVPHQVNNNTAVPSVPPPPYQGFDRNTSASTKSLNNTYSNPASSAQQCCPVPPTSNANVAHTGYSYSSGYRYGSGSGSRMRQNRFPPPGYPYGYNAHPNWSQYPVYKETSSTNPSLNATANTYLNSFSNYVQGISASTGIQASNRSAVTTSNSQSPTETISPLALPSASSAISANARQNSTLNISQPSQKSTDHLSTSYSSHSSRNKIPTSSGLTVHYIAPTNLVIRPKHTQSGTKDTRKMIQKKTTDRYNELAPKVHVKVTPSRFSTTVTKPSNVSSNFSENAVNEIHPAASSNSNIAVPTTVDTNNAQTSKGAKIDVPFISPESVISEIPLPAKVRASTVFIPAISPDSAVSNLSFVSQLSPPINDAAPLDGQNNNIETPDFNEEQQNTYSKNSSNLKKPNEVMTLPTSLTDPLSKKLSSASSVNSSEAENNKDRSPSVCSRDSGVIEEMINDEESNENLLEVSRSVLCSMCEKLASMSCGRCRLSCYCSEKCQKAHWELNHSHSCSKPNSGRK